MDKFLVLKVEDIEKYLNFRQTEDLKLMCLQIMDGREAKGKPRKNDYMVLNKEEAKAYVVTSGEYSDYSIEKVFLDKAEAERYANATTCFSNRMVEEYDFVELKQEQEIVHHIRVVYNRYADDSEEFNVTFHTASSIEYEDFREIESTDYSEQTYHHYNLWGDTSKKNLDKTGYYQIVIQRLVKEPIDKEKLTAKYTKVCQDLMTKARYFRNDGIPLYEVGELIGGE